MIERPSSAVRDLLRRAIDSFEKLELVLYLHRANRPVPRSELENAVGGDPAAMARWIAELTASGLFVRASPTQDSAVRLELSGARGAALADLIRLCDEDRLVVLTTLSQIALDRIRGMAARTFADAFELRKPTRPKKNGDG